MAGSLMLTVALAAGCERESKGPRVYNHPPATVGPPADLSQFKAHTPPPQEEPPAPSEARPAPAPQIAAPPPAADGLEPHPEVAAVVDMAKRGIGDEALLAYIEKNPVTHRVSPETIIFLNDLGVPEKVVALMIRQGDTKEAAQPIEPVPVQQLVKTTGQPAASPPSPAPAPATAPPVDSNQYYGALDPYGDWIYDGKHGWVWRPTAAVVDVSWRPYRQGGRWIYSDVGWYWHSYYSWGWAPFHYGRWHRSSPHGWYWVPGYTWSPAWVMWRSNDLYCGWAPLPPGCNYVHGIGYTWGGSHVGFSFGFGLGHGWFTYCDYAHLRHRRLHRHRVRDNRVAIIHNETTVVNNYVTENNNTIINTGIPPAVVAKKTREPVQKMRIRELDLEMESIARVGQIDANGKTMAVYRPKTPAPGDTPGEKPGGRTPGGKTPPGESPEDKPEADSRLLKKYGNAASVAKRSKINGTLTPRTLTRPLSQRSYSSSRRSGTAAKSANSTPPAKAGRSATASAKPSASSSRTLTSTFSAPSTRRSKPTKPSSRKTYSRTAPSSTWQKRATPSFSAPRSTQSRTSPKSTSRTSRLPTARTITPSYKPSASRQSRPAPSRSYSAPTASRPTPSRSYRRSSPSSSAPSRSRSAPSRSYSAPSRSYSPPSSSSSSSSEPSRSSGGGKDPR